MESREQEPLARFAREHHVHYEVEREEVLAGGRRDLVGVQVRLFAMHEEGKPLEKPGCAKCNELLDGLRAFAGQLVHSTHATSRAEIVAEPPKLYRSTEVPDADEVALTVRVRCDAPEHRRTPAGEDRCVGEIRDRLHAIGVPRR